MKTRGILICPGSSAAETQMALCPDLSQLRLPWLFASEYGSPISAVPAYFALRALQFEQDARYCFAIPEQEVLAVYVIGDLQWNGLELFERALQYWSYVEQKLYEALSITQESAGYLYELHIQAGEQRTRVASLYSQLLMLPPESQTARSEECILGLDIPCAS